MSRNQVIEELRSAVSRGEIDPITAAKLMAASQVEIYYQLEEINTHVQVTNGRLTGAESDIKNLGGRVTALEAEEAERDMNEDEIAKANVKQIAADREERTITWPLLLSNIGWPVIMIIIGAALTYILTHIH